MNITNSTAHNSPTTVPPTIAARINISNNYTTHKNTTRQSILFEQVDICTRYSDLMENTQLDYYVDVIHRENVTRVSTQISKNKGFLKVLDFAIKVL